MNFVRKVPALLHAIRRMAILFGAGLCGLCFAAEVPRRDCGELLSALSPDSPTARYLRTVSHLAIDKHAFPQETLKAIADSTNALDPLSLSTKNLTTTELHVYREILEPLLKEGADWNVIREGVKRLFTEISQGYREVEKHDEKARPVFLPRVVKKNIFPEGEKIQLKNAFQTKNNEILLAVTWPASWDFGVPNHGILSQEGKTLLKLRRRIPYDGGFTDMLETDEQIFVGGTFHSSLSRRYEFWSLTPPTHLRNLSLSHPLPPKLKDGKLFFGVRPSIWDRLTSDIYAASSSDGKHTFEITLKRGFVRIRDTARNTTILLEKLTFDPYEDLRETPTMINSRGELYIAFTEGLTLDDSGHVFDVGRKKWITFPAEAFGGTYLFLETKSGDNLLASFSSSGIVSLNLGTGAIRSIEGQFHWPHDTSLQELPDGRIVGIAHTPYSDYLTMYDLVGNSYSNFPIPKSRKLRFLKVNSKGQVFAVSDGDGGSILQLYGLPEGK